MRVSLAALTVAALTAGAAHAETINCTAITALPYTIAASGIYCLTADLSSNLASGNIIEIAANNVVLDLNAHRLSGLPAGTGTIATGIHAASRQNVTIKNGVVRGFYSGIRLDFDTQAVIEGVYLERNTYYGIFGLGSRGSLIRRNTVLNTGGSTAGAGDASAIGIFVAGQFNRIIDNDVIVVTKTGQGNSTGIYFGSIPSDGFAVGNRITSADYGIAIAGSTKFRDNVTTAVGLAYSGGINVGNNQ